MFGFSRSRIQVRNVSEAKPIPIVGDAAIATQQMGDGRLIVLLIVDTSERADLQELIRLHALLPPGDVGCQWGSLKSDAQVALILNFIRPAEMTAILEFDVVEQGCLVEQILHSNGLYLQAGKPGDKIRTTLDAPRIFIEVPDTRFRPIWDRIFRKHLTKYARLDGVSRQEARNRVAAWIKEWRKFGNFRVGMAGVNEAEPNDLK